MSTTEAVGSPDARTRTIEWHATLRLPVRVAKPKRITSYTYDSKGNMLSKTVQATTDANGSQPFAAPVGAIPSQICKVQTGLIKLRNE